MPNERDGTEPPQQADAQKAHKGKIPLWVKRSFYVFAAFIILAAAALGILIKSDLGEDFLSGRVQAKLQQKIGAFADVNIENARLSLDDDYHIALKVDNAPITPHDGAITLSKIGRLRFGLAMQPLLRRKIEVVQLEADNASVLIRKQDNDKGLFAALPHDAHQRLDFDALAQLCFSAAEKLAAQADKLKINTFRFRNITFTISSPQGEQNFTLRQFRLRRLYESMDLQAIIAWQGQDISLNASAALGADGKARNFTAKAENLPLRLGADDAAKPYLLNGRPNNGFFRMRGLADVSLSGDSENGAHKKLTASAAVREGKSDISIEAQIPTEFALNAAYEQGSGGLVFADSRLRLGGLNLPFSGRIGPAALPEAAKEQGNAGAPLPADAPPINTTASAANKAAVGNAGESGDKAAAENAGESGDKAGGQNDAGIPTAQQAEAAQPLPADRLSGLYEFRLKAADAVSSPADSPAAALNFDLDLSGRIAALNKKANLDQIILQTESGAIFGNGSVRFGAERWPELIFILRSRSLPIDEAKQLWPIDISRSARRWVLSHIFGGNLANMQMEIAIPEGFYQKGKLPPLLTEKELRISTGLENSRADLVGALPPLRAAFGQVQLKGMSTAVHLDKALAYIDGGKQINAANGRLNFTWQPGKPLWADLSVHIDGEVGPMGALLACEPINAARKLPFDTQKASGMIHALLNMNFPLYKGAKQKDKGRPIVWNADIGFENFALTEPYHGAIEIKGATGRVQIDNKLAQIDGKALLNNIPADISLLLPTDRQGKQDAAAAEGAQTGGANITAAPERELITFHINDKLRNKLFPALNIFLKGDMDAAVGAESQGRRHIQVDLSKSALQIPWIGWKKSAGIAAKAEMNLPMAGGLKNIDIDDFVLSGPNFQIAGKIKIRDGNLVSADFSNFALNRGDKMGLSVSKNGQTYAVKLNGQSFDMRALIKHLTESGQINAEAGGAAADIYGSKAVSLTAAIDKAQGFNNENLSNFRAVYNRSAAGADTVNVSAATKAGAAFNMRESKQKALRQISVVSDDAGAFLRFMNYYGKVQGGRLETKLQSVGSGAALSGAVRISDFAIINEPKLASIAGSSGKGGKGKGGAYLAVERAYGHITKGENSLSIDGGVLRGPSVGATFQGRLYDSSGNIAMTGTYMPAYGINRIVGEVPILGSVLGNGRDKGLIGITFKIEGKFKTPKIVINPISAMAPGVLRSIFEFK